MNKKTLWIFTSLLVICMLIMPVFAKTKTEIKAIQIGTMDLETAEKVLFTPNEKIQHYWGVDGTGTAILYQSDGVTEIDTFATSSVIQRKDKDGSIMMSMTMTWESVSVSGGFEGIIQWRKTADGPMEMKGVYQGYGFYEGQTLKLEGTAVPGLQTYTGTLIA